MTSALKTAIEDEQLPPQSRSSVSSPWVLASLFLRPLRRYLEENGGISRMPGSLDYRSLTDFHHSGSFTYLAMASIAPDDSSSHWKTFSSHPARRL